MCHDKRRICDRLTSHPCPCIRERRHYIMCVCVCCLWQCTPALDAVFFFFFVVFLVPNKPTGMVCSLCGNVVPHSQQASALRQPTSPPPPCPASSPPSSTDSPASLISPTGTPPWRRCTPMACHPTPPRAPPPPTPCSKLSLAFSNTQVGHNEASVAAWSHLLTNASRVISYKLITTGCLQCIRTRHQSAFDWTRYACMIDLKHPWHRSLQDPLVFYTTLSLFLCAFFPQQSTQPPRWLPSAKHCPSRRRSSSSSSREKVRVRERYYFHTSPIPSSCNGYKKQRWAWETNIAFTVYTSQFCGMGK